MRPTPCPLLKNKANPNILSLWGSNHILRRQELTPKPTPTTFKTVVVGALTFETFHTAKNLQPPSAASALPLPEDFASHVVHERGRSVSPCVTNLQCLVDSCGIVWIPPQRHFLGVVPSTMKGLGHSFNWLTLRFGGPKPQSLFGGSHPIVGLLLELVHSRHVQAVQVSVSPLRSSCPNFY